MNVIDYKERSNRENRGGATVNHERSINHGHLDSELDTKVASKDTKATGGKDATAKKAAKAAEPAKKSYGPVGAITVKGVNLGLRPVP